MAQKAVFFFFTMLWHRDNISSDYSSSEKGTMVQCHLQTKIDFFEKQKEKLSLLLLNILIITVIILSLTKNIESDELDVVLKLFSVFFVIQ